MAFLLAACCFVCVGVVLGAPPSGHEESTGFHAPLDLSHPINELSQNWPGSRTFQFTKEVASNNSETGGFLAHNEFCMSEHSGTHLDAPFHFHQSAWKVGQIPLKHLMAPGVLIDASEATAANRDLSLGKDALVDWEQKHGRIPEGSIVLLRFGWAAKYGDRKDYYGMSSDDRNHTDTNHLSFPGASKELAESLAERKIAGVGLDTPSIDPGQSGDHAPLAHRLFCKANIFILENVNLKTTALPAKDFTLIVMPMNIESGSGAPVRIVAVPGTINFWTQ